MLSPSRHIILVFGSIILFAFGAIGQEVETDTIKVPKGSVAEKLADRSFKDAEKGLLKQEFTAGIQLHAQGWGINVRRSKNKTFKRKRVIEGDIVTMTHPKEIKVVNPYYENAEPYVYGRKFQMLITRVGYGRQNVLYQRFDQGVEIRYLYIAGLSVGWAKPVYLEIGKNDNGSQSIPYDRVVTERYNEDLHNTGNIFGAASFVNGFNRMKVNPGVYGKAAISFDYAKRQKSISTIEAGVVIDGYFQVVELMANTYNAPFFVNLYVSLNFGTKWYKP